MSADRAAGILARFTSAHNTLLTKLREMPPGAEHRHQTTNIGAPRRSAVMSP